MLYTGKGDDGTSGLFGTTDRFPKDAAIYDALGTLDELNSHLGVCRARANIWKKNGQLIATELVAAQGNVFIVQAELAGADKKIEAEAIEMMEKTIRGIDTMIGGRHSFVIPGETELAGLLDVARAVSRRAERAVVGVREFRELERESMQYLNRLSSLLYALARYAALKANIKEPSPAYY